MPYFDHNATTPLSPVAREAWLNAQADSWQNPSSPYRAGTRAGLRLQGARETLAKILGCEAKRIVFTGGATEAAHAIMQHLSEQLPADAWVAVNPTEHAAVLGGVGAYFHGPCVRALALAPGGVVNLASVDTAIAAGAKLIVVMAANNETGVLQPWREIAQRCRAAGVAMVCDGSQWFGKLACDGLVEADWVFGAAHKFGGPKGVGFLLRPAADNGFVMRRGGSQEGGQRGGTEDLAGISAMVAALLDAEQTKVLHEGDRERTRDAFESEMARRLPGAVVVASAVERLWNTVSLMLPHGENHRWVARLDRRQMEVSSGSACASGKEAPSHVLAAMQIDGARARRVIRISAGWDTTPADWQALADALVAVAPETQAAANVVPA